MEPLIVALGKDPDGDIRAQAAHQLGNFTDPRALKPLAKALEDEPGVKARAEMSIKRIQAKIKRVTPL